MRRLWWALIPLVLIAVAVYLWPAASEPPRLEPGWTAVIGVIADDVTFAEPAGAVVTPDGFVYVVDGAGGNSVHAITPSGFTAVIAGGAEGFQDGPGPLARFRTPTGIAADDHGTLYVADTGNDAIRAISRDGVVRTIATGLNGPMGVAIDQSGQLVVADTYNDRIARIAADGRVETIISNAQFDTPAGIAADKTGAIYVADTGNNVIHVIAADGRTITLDAAEAGGLERPSGIAVDDAGTIYVTDESNRVVEIESPLDGARARVLAGQGAGYRNGIGREAQFRRPLGIAAAQRGHLVVADAGNALVRTIVAASLAEVRPPPSPRPAPVFDVAAFTQTPLLWPLEPLAGPFEIAGTIGEARGADAGRFHAGIDVRADNGASVVAVREGVVTAPLSTGDFGTLNEWLRLGELSYVHLRVGRTARGELTDSRRFVASRDERGRIVRVRVKRGARFHTGDVIGSVNQFNHVHLNVGWGGEEYNPLLFRLVQFEDNIPPTIAPGGIQLFDAEGKPFRTRINGRLQVSGEVQIVVDAWDQADGNRPSRRLGVYSLGYQVLDSKGVPAAGYESPLETIRFDRLMAHPDATRLVYAPGSGIPFYGGRRTRFLYIVTNTFRGGVASPGMWDTTRLEPGDYTLRIRVADINGNEAQQRRDVPVTIAGRGDAAGG